MYFYNKIESYLYDTKMVDYKHVNDHITPKNKCHQQLIKPLINIKRQKNNHNIRDYLHSR